MFYAITSPRSWYRLSRHSSQLPGICLFLAAYNFGQITYFRLDKGKFQLRLM